MSLIEWVTQSTFTEITALMVLATVIGFIGLLMKQPLIVSFIAVGLIAGPSVLDIVHSKEQITLLSELGLDFSPETIKHWNQLGLDTQYGDVTDAEFITELPLRHAQWIVSTIPYHHTGISSEDTRKTIVQLTRVAGFSGKIATVSHSKTETEELKILGIDLVFEPFQDAADRASELLLDGMDIQLSEQK
ncbi:MAG: hypothetical protein AXW15_12325 [Neptuniibacter sp. Phe_28]|nr:MAG: hypothetical protein AXW15_12325 [Neptuniibacter sp. Phe_28]